MFAGGSAGGLLYRVPVDSLVGELGIGLNAAANSAGSTWNQLDPCELTDRLLVVDVDPAGPMACAVAAWAAESVGEAAVAGEAGTGMTAMAVCLEPGGVGCPLGSKSKNFFALLGSVVPIGLEPNWRSVVCLIVCSDLFISSHHTIVILISVRLRLDVPIRHFGSSDLSQSVRDRFPLFVRRVFLQVSFDPCLKIFRPFVYVR